MSIDPQSPGTGFLPQSNPHEFAADLTCEGDRVIVTARGQLELGAQPILAASLARAIATGQREIVVDVSGLESIDSEDVGLLVRARRLLQQRGQHLMIRSPCSNAELLVACALLDPLATVGHITDGDGPCSWALT